jgi:hypothetical protein
MIEQLASHSPVARVEFQLTSVGWYVIPGICGQRPR